ncbi:MAG: hypothetical protein KGS72_08045 [Cyanobacteria bacterium REEB67]|nr:hypothetical protein [Cyanobacteria bacterium REEB67]
MDALEIIENLKKAYGNFETYRDAGVTKSSDALTKDAQAPLQHFQTTFRRPLHYRCQCHYELTAASSHPELTATDGVLWSDGTTSRHYSNQAETAETVPDAAHLFGPSLDPIFKGKAQVPDLIARMLMPSIFKEYDQFPLAREYWSVSGEEEIAVGDGRSECWQVTQDLIVYKESLWIAKSDYTLRQHSRDIDYSFLDHARVKSLIDTGSKMVRYLFKNFPDINKEILERGPRHYRTHFNQIAVNEPIADHELAAGFE